MRSPNADQLIEIVRDASSRRRLTWDGAHELELHSSSRRVLLELPGGCESLIRDEYVAVEDDGVIVLVPPDEQLAVRAYAGYRELKRQVHPRLLENLRSLILAPGPHPTSAATDAITQAVRRWVCIFHLASLPPSLFLFEHELGHILSRKTRLGRGMAHLSVLPEWEQACTEDKKLHTKSGSLWRRLVLPAPSSPSFIWHHRWPGDPESAKQISTGRLLLSAYAASRTTHYQRFEEELADSIALLLASRRSNGLAVAEGTLDFDAVFPNRSAVIDQLLAA